MKLNMFLALTTLLLIASCKKDTSSTNGVITFTINGSSKSLNIYTNTLVNLDTLNIQEKTLVLASAGVVSGPALNNGVGFVIEQNLALPGSGSFALGPYRDAAFNANCTGNGIYPSGCSTFYFSYYDPTLGSLTPSSTDSTGYLYLTAFSNSPDLISGNFSCQVSDGNGNLYQVTAGSFLNVPFVNQ